MNMTTPIAAALWLSLSTILTSCGGKDTRYAEAATEGTTKEIVTRNLDGSETTLTVSTHTYTVDGTSAADCKVRETGSKSVVVTSAANQAKITFRRGTPAGRKLFYFQDDSACDPVSGDIGAGKSNPVTAIFAVPATSASPDNACRWTADSDAPPCVISIAVRHQ